MLSSKLRGVLRVKYAKPEGAGSGSTSEPQAAQATGQAAASIVQRPWSKSGGCAHRKNKLSTISSRDNEQPAPASIKAHTAEMARDACVGVAVGLAQTRPGDKGRPDFQTTQAYIII